ncbi:hypothetical protein [Agitococcus lubricus]|uniref:DUF4124 domain-containing protein n=1 Tax=Agitococcus lubricus TaxID=1077255 RepID=A0A2T5IYS5_9GAMM|nr:hypothetical protein [Agitococcus lubricus]PTQ89160.1 hypothetical protein C8N29_10841 [Agitococcus lubricus]
MIAAPATKGSSTGGAKQLYRYYDDKGRPTVSDQLTDEHVSRGYDIVNRHMQLIKRVPPFDANAYARDKAKRDAALIQAAEDKRIQRLFGSVRDAELARNRQVDTLDSSINFNTLQLIRIKRLRAEAVEDAASAERKGEVPSKKLKSQIADYDGQIKDLEQLIASQRSDQDKVKSDFIPIIKRLGELEDASTDSSISANATFNKPN